ncbi:hypothetical protein [Microlunatus kandeliicorticis]|nr:hypothetical protein [Microlunatus kandeliicorticis]
MAIDRARPEPEPDGDWIRRVAQQSSTEALLRSGRLSADVLPTLVQEVMSLANGYDTESRLAGLRHARDVSEVASTLADRTRRPSELVDLYASLGQLNALMASLAFDLDRWDAAETLARTASSYADMSGHSSLHAWTLGLRATLAFWRADPRLALDHVDHGLAIAPMGAPSYRLHHIEARAHAVAGNVEGVRASIGAANAQLDFMEGLRDDLHDGIGGEFAFGYVRGTACAGAAWLRVGDGHQALKTTYRAIRALVSDPAPSTNVVNGLLIDGAAASALDGDIATARALITPALDLSPDRSTVSTTGRLKNVLTVLRPLEANREARELAEQAEAYLAAGRLAAEAAKPRPLGD